MEARTDTVKEKDPIAWIEMKHYGDIVEIKQDIRELSKRVNFEITRFETCKSPDSRNGNIIIRAYTDTFEKIPRDKLPIVRKWLSREIYWTQHVCNAKAKIETN
ncbi:hypothetical protein AKJ52_01370 [candidate division MSBL1 archaeon SCGC-AAA382C18]|uniref:Uncharacterized protein n=1 Tax=candidate division MSBL1 archaeon SCGC-AAA382C18 TaxID=1698281 RepID=A0A133VKA4_9EURY|nr:hypothetical protein AKJ52_01370 [candidate division MSBL1 archaeon SCGC-AAA382C18]